MGPPPLNVYVVNLRWEEAIKLVEKILSLESHQGDINVNLEK
jgi:hypothetical protein